MNLEEFRKQAKEIRADAERQVKKLGKELAFANASAKIGDTVTSKQTIIVDDIKFSMKSYMQTGESPECVYFGFVLTKAGRPRKDGERGMIYESDLAKA